MRQRFPVFLVTGIALFGVSVFGETPWTGDGLPARTDAAWYDPDPAPEFRTTFVAPSAGPVQIRVACAGYYALSINGRPVTTLTKTSLMPLWSPYDKTVYEDTVEVPADFLRPAPAFNELRVRLGKGWYDFPPLRFWGQIEFAKSLAHGRPCFRLSVDGVGTLDWTWRETQVVQNSIHLGVIEDRTRDEDTVWKKAAAVKGPAGRIVPRRTPPVDVIGTRAGTVHWLKEGAVQIVDFGVNTTGVPRFRFAGTKRGEKIEIVYGERLNRDGSVNVLTQTAGQIKAKYERDGGPGSPATAEQRDVLVCRGGAEESFEPPFAWHACRYAEIRGARESVRLAELDEISSAVQDIEPGRSFYSENEDLNRLHEICRRSFRSNLIGVQSDCPGRERLGYGGDIVASCEALMLNWDMREFYLKTLQDFADEAVVGGGWIPDTAPYVGIHDPFFGGRAGHISWALAVPVLIDALMRHYPDVTDRALAFYPVCLREVRLVDAKCPDGIVPTCTGDHEALERAPNDLTATAHWQLFVRLTASFARRLGRTAEAEELEAMAVKIANAFVGKFLKDGGYVGNGTQSAQAIALYLGLVPADKVAAAERLLEETLWRTDYAPTTGIFSTRYLLMYLSEHGKCDLARKVVLHRGFPGFMHMLEKGATTLWETWKESDDAFSNNHPMFGSVDEWLIRFANDRKVSVGDSAAVVTNIVRGTCAGDVTLVCPSAVGWRLQMTRTEGTESETDELLVTLENDAEAAPPKFEVSFAVPQQDIHFAWDSSAENLRLAPSWRRGFVSTLAKGMPLVELLGTDDRNRLAFAASESVLPVRCRAGLRERDCQIPCSLTFFETASAPMRSYRVRIRLDGRRRRWDATVRDLTDWIGKAGDYVPLVVPEGARDPLYSTWYAFNQDVSARAVEDEARRAAALGMKTLILDDGWQTDEKGRAYERCGDMTVSAIKFPEGMAAHVRKVKEAGLRYVVWVAVPFVGYKNAAFERFKGKYLKDEKGLHCSILDPRFPEVREYLASLYEKMMREWGLNGFKFDYVGMFALKEEDDDPAIAQNFAGRDTRSVADAVDALMTQILTRLKAVNPDVLIEYRQPYLSPGIRRFGNMIRALDCPGEMQKNLIRTTMLRLTSGKTAVHSDMLEWHPEDAPERAAQQILAALFSTVQYSVVLSRLPPSHLKMMRHWIGFAQRNRAALLKGTFTAFHPEANYPLVSSESDAERVIGVYVGGTLVPMSGDKSTTVVNGTGGGSLAFDLQSAPTSVRVCDTFGKCVAMPKMQTGFARLAVPVSGYVEFEFK